MATTADTAVQTRRQDNHLTNTRPPGGGEEFVQEPSVYRKDIDAPND